MLRWPWLTLSIEGNIGLICLCFKIDRCLFDLDRFNLHVYQTLNLNLIFGSNRIYDQFIHVKPYLRPVYSRQTVFTTSLFKSNRIYDQFIQVKPYLRPVYSSQTVFTTSLFTSNCIYDQFIHIKPYLRPVYSHQTVFMTSLFTSSCIYDQFIHIKPYLRPVYSHQTVFTTSLFTSNRIYDQFIHVWHDTCFNLMNCINHLLHAPHVLLNMENYTCSVNRCIIILTNETHKYIRLLVSVW
jgi:hypothetical protein